MIVCLQNFNEPVFSLTTAIATISALLGAFSLGFIIIVRNKMAERFGIPLK